MGPLARVCAAGVVLASIAGCGDDDGGERMVELCMHSFDAGPEAGPEAGVALGCPRHQTCDTSSVEPQCICQDGYEGEGCDSCERGWRTEFTDAGVECVALPINCASDPCGIGGECVSIGGVDRCQCETGYDGRYCSRCAIGFQDNDGDGECTPGCRLTGLECPGRRECSDLSGEPECVCIEGYAGESCDTCASGYRPTGTGGCLATCSVAELDCGAHGACADLDGPPRCVCDVGYAGEGCSECAVTHREDGMGGCIGDPPPGYTLMATATGERGEPILAAVQPGAAAPVGLAMLDRPVGPIAHDSADDRLYGVASGTLVEIDRHYGTVTDVMPLPGVGLRSSLAWDPGRQLLYAMEDGGSLVSIDPTTGETATVTGSGILSSWEASLAYDDATDRLFGASGASARFEVDPVDGTVRNLTPLAVDTTTQRLALAVEPTTGLPWAVADRTESDTERLASACREVAEAMRYPIPDSTLVGGYGDPDPTMPDAPLVLEYEGVDPPLVVYGSYGDRSAAPRPLRVATSHPDAVVCVVTYEEVLDVVVAADARFHYLLLVSYEPTLTLEVEDGFEPKVEGVPPIRVYVVDEPVDPSLMGPEELVRFYTRSEWSALGVTVDPWSSSSARVLPRLLAIDWESGALFERAVELRSFAGGLTPFGEAP